MKAWIVTSPVRPPLDWGFKKDRWNSRYFRVTTSRLHAQQILRDLQKLEIPRVKCRQINNLHLTT